MCLSIKFLFASSKIIPDRRTGRAVFPGNGANIYGIVLYMSTPFFRQSIIFKV